MIRAFVRCGDHQLGRCGDELRVRNARDVRTLSWSLVNYGREKAGGDGTYVSLSFYGSVTVFCTMPSQTHT
jgi:hypothetical protein